MSMRDSMFAVSRLLQLSSPLTKLPICHYTALVEWKLYNCHLSVCYAWKDEETESMWANQAWGWAGTGPSGQRWMLWVGEVCLWQMWI